MPKTPRNPAAIEEIKENILTEALRILIDEGFQGLSMRKLASRLRMTAANIYNYYQNKDELYLTIQTRGFEKLYESLEDIYLSVPSPEERLEKMVQAYVAFGMAFPEYYEIMLSRNTPKYRDYVGTPMEPVALVEKEAALKVFALAQQAVADTGRVGTGEASAYWALRFWGMLHGLVSLYNSRVLQEVDDHADSSVASLIKDLLYQFWNQPEEAHQSMS